LGSESDVADVSGRAYPASVFGYLVTAEHEWMGYWYVWGTGNYQLTLESTSKWSLNLTGSGYSRNTPIATASPYNVRVTHRLALGNGQHWKARVYGPTWGTLCVYDPLDQADFDSPNYDGPVDAELIDVVPASYEHKAVAEGSYFDLGTSGSPVAPGGDGGVYGKPVITMFWPGLNSEDFPWYLSSAAAGLSTGEGPKTTD
jgi:hypothetical protein